MKTALFVLITALAIPAQAATRAGGHPFGLGLELGEPTGLTAKLYLDQPFALQFGVGYVDDFDYDTGLHLFLDFVFHPVVLARAPAFTMPLYLGVGARLLDHDFRYYYNRTVYYADHDTRLGVRVPFGLLMDFNRVPLDVFVEIALVVDVFVFNRTYDPYYNYSRVGWNGDIGIRYYF